MSLSQVDDKNALLIFRVGPVYCCAPALNVETVMLPPTLHHTPGSSEFAGVFRHTQGMVSVIDLRQRFGVDISDWHQPGRIIVAEVTGGLAGFWVDEVDDVTPWPQTGWGQIPPLVPRKVFKRTLLHKQHIHLYADFEELFRYRESGYLRQHIQALQQQGAKTTAAETDMASATAIKAGHESAPKKTFSPDLPEHVNTVTPPQAPAVPVAPATSHRTGSTTAASPPKPQLPIKPPVRHAPATVSSTAAMTARAELTPTAKPAHETIVANQPVQQPPAPVTKPDSTLWYLGGFGALLLTLVWLLLWPADEPRRPSMTASAPASSQATAVEPDPTPTAEADYQARIARDDEGIVITLEVPADDIAATPVETLNPAPSSPAEPTPPATSVHVHIVVKGDTLWDIASHYVHNPWRYPELAKLSKISNPHRIYPGDKVKIILHKK